MRNQKTALLLIILMLISPIASAFDHCSGMTLPNQVSNTINSYSNSLAAHNRLIEKQGMHHHYNSKPNQTEIDCQTTFSCNAYAITQPPASTFSRFDSLSYYAVEYTPLPSTILSPTFRPPILLL